MEADDVGALAYERQSVDNLKVSQRYGCSPKGHQMCATLPGYRTVYRARRRVPQRVASFSTDFSMHAITVDNFKILSGRASV